MVVRWNRCFGACVFMLVACSPPAEAGSEQLLSLSPVGEHTSIAVPIVVPEGAMLTGLRWMNNDSTIAFPLILLLEGAPGVPPNLDDTGMILTQVFGAELQDSEISLPAGVTSSTGFIYAVWVLPPEGETTGSGDGNGPGIGLIDGHAGAPFYVSFDGIDWISWTTDQHLQVEPVTQSASLRAEHAPRVLSQSARELQYRVPRPEPVGATDGHAPDRSYLHFPVPNPFNPRTEITFSIAASGPVTLMVYNLRGELVSSLVQGDLAAGTHAEMWDGRDQQGKPVSSGVYLVRLQVSGIEQSRKVTLLR